MFSRGKGRSKSEHIFITKRWSFCSLLACVFLLGIPPPNEQQRSCVHNSIRRIHGAVWTESAKNPISANQCKECSCTVRNFFISSKLLVLLRFSRISTPNRTPDRCLFQAWVHGLSLESILYSPRGLRPVAVVVITPDLPLKRYLFKTQLRLLCFCVWCAYSVAQYFLPISSFTSLHLETLLYHFTSFFFLWGRTNEPSCWLCHA